MWKLRPRHKRAEAGVHGFIAAFAQRGVADQRRPSENFRQRYALLLDPLYARRSPTNVAGQRALNGRCCSQFIGQNTRIFHSHAAALSHHGRAGMGSIADQHHPTAVPFFGFHPFHG